MMMIENSTNVSAYKWLAGCSVDDAHFLSLSVVFRQMVHYVADHWINYKSLRQQAGDGLHAPPTSENPGLPRYSLARLQVEFDQFVIRATQWILTAHR